MKKILSVIIILFSLTFVLAQEVPQKPLTQAEYVKMLYMIDQKPSLTNDLVEAIRSRGLGFKLTDGLRSLTRSKSRNDLELQRTLEESERRRANPTTAKLPSETEATQVLAETQKNTLAALEDMPDFAVKQRIARSYAYAGTGNFRSLDSLVIGVSYRASGFEEYRTLSINGVQQPEPKAKKSFQEAGGTSSTGEFVTVLAKIFKPESETRFKLIDTDLIRERNALVFGFSITKDKAQQLVTSYQYVADSTITGMSGKIWIDRKDMRVLRIETDATEIPASFPIRSADRTIDYDWVSISDQLYLLPTVSDVRLTFRQRDKVFETRNLIRFKDYQKFGTEFILLDDDVEEAVPAEQPTEVDENAPPPLLRKP